MSPARILNQAKNACGEEAVVAAEKDDYKMRDKWVELATDISELERRAINLMSEVPNA